MSKKWTEEGPLMDITTTPVFVDIGTRSLMYEVKKMVDKPIPVDTRSIECGNMDKKWYIQLR
jgi:hypothetical protein